jgi:CubicO group peptidase (beta-lactamase class C family)
MAGSPPEGDDLITLSSWQDPPSIHWAFQHMRELIPSQPIPAGEGPATPLRPGPDLDLAEITVKRLSGEETPVEDVVAETHTDALLVLHRGRLLAERYYDGCTPETEHLLMSVSKSIVGCVAGVLADVGRLDPAARVRTYVPEVEGSGYGDATVRDVLDMRTGVLFREAYEDMDAEIRVMERSMGWRPRHDSDPVGAYAYLATLRQEGPHGGRFTYRSSDTDMLGWVCERASGSRMADLVSELIWQPMGAESPAEITCDAVGTGIHDGGISAVARDVARFGQMLHDHGRVGARQVVPGGWLDDAWGRPDDVREAFAVSDNDPVLPGGWYRNQFWFVPQGHGEALVCLGIHGQMIYVNRRTGLVGVKLSSWPTPQHTASLVDTLRAFAAIGAHCDSRK